MHENDISKIILNSSIEVHRTLGGPGFLESVGVNFGERMVKDGFHHVVKGL